MALPSPIPTSFVPHSSSASTRLGIASDYMGALGFIAYSIFFLVLVATFAEFAYDRVLVSQETVKNAEVAKAESNLDPSTVETFLRLRNRLVESETLLQNHTAFSTFLSSIETILPSTVRLTSLHLSEDSTGALQVSLAATAQDFNSLGAFSNEINADSHFTHVVFSNITIDAKTGQVSFTLNAVPDASLIEFDPEVSATSTVPSSIATSTASTTPP